MTIASMTMNDVADQSSTAKGRGIGLLTIATGIAAFALLAAHPADDARTFADVVKNEAAGQFIDAVVHGGFIVVLALQVVCYAVLSGRVGLQHTATVAGLVFFAVGMAFFCASLLVDGLVTPAIAARYVAKPDKIESARVLFVLMGTMVGFLMPMGLAFQSAAIAAWGWALTARGQRAAGLFGLFAGGLMAAAVAASFAMMNPMILMGAILVAGIWAMVVGVLMLRGTV